MNCEDMLAHPWMNVELDSATQLSTAKTKLSKYISVRKDKSQRFKKEHMKQMPEEDDF